MSIITVDANKDKVKAAWIHYLKPTDTESVVSNHHNSSGGSRGGGALASISPSHFLLKYDQLCFYPILCQHVESQKGTDQYPKMLPGPAWPWTPGQKGAMGCTTRRDVRCAHFNLLRPLNGTSLIRPCYSIATTFKGISSISLSSLSYHYRS